MNKKVRMQIVLPQDVARELRKYVVKRSWSDFVSEAVKEKLEKENVRNLILETSGSLKDGEK